MSKISAHDTKERLRIFINDLLFIEINKKDLLLIHSRIEFRENIFYIKFMYSNNSHEVTIYERERWEKILKILELKL